MEDNKLDLVSDLPFEILKHVISFLPLKEAVRSTSSLSTTWRQLLAPLHVPEPKGSVANIQEVLAKFLSSYVSPERWKVTFHTRDEGEDLLAKEDVGLDFMATKGVEKELHLHFLENSRKDKTTTSHGFHLNMQQTHHSLENVQSHASFSSLKTLHLRSVNHHAISLVSDLFACCRSLESLKLEKCHGLEDLHVDGCNSLQSLEILECEDIVSITICAPNLKSFSYRGVLPRMQLKSTSELVEANLDLRYGLGGNEFDCEDVLRLLASLKEVQILTISGWLLEMDHNFSSIPCPFFHQYWHEPHLWMDYEMVKSNTSQLIHLKEFELSGFSSEEDELLLMELLLNKAVVLESMTVT